MQLPELLIPGHAADEVSVDHDVTLARAFDEHLQALDERLRCFWVKPDAPGWNPSGRWYVGLFHSNPELSQFWAISNADGSYSEPKQEHLDAIMAMDTHTGAQSYAKVEQARTRKQQEKAKRKEETRREFRELLDERLAHTYNARISVPKSLVVPQPGGLTRETEKVPVVERKIVLP